MELKDNQYKFINFISDSEREELIRFTDSLKDINLSVTNIHIETVAKELNGNSYMFDITKTPVSQYLSTFQSSDNIIDLKLPDIVYGLIERISKILQIPKDSVFLQIVDMNKGGKILPHYDTGIEGYINYKCNISVLSEDYSLYVDKDKLDIKQGDLYCFEASLFKHWTEAFNSRRILFSFGFGLPYHILGRKSDDPRVNLSRRIYKHFQKSDK